MLTLMNEKDAEDKNTNELSVYRHQEIAIKRKKAGLVEKLQKNR